VQSFRLMCIVEFKKKIKNCKLLIRVATSSSNNSIQPVPEWQWQLWPTISRLSCERTSGREPRNSVWRSCGLRCHFLWTKCTDHFSCAATQFLVINATPALCAMWKATTIARWMTWSSSFSFWRPRRQTFDSAASICLVTEIIMSTMWYKNINSPRRHARHRIRRHAHDDLKRSRS